MIWLGGLISTISIIWGLNVAVNVEVEENWASLFS